jgi:hypothetical protein
MVSRERRSANPEHYQEYDRKWRMANPKSVRSVEERTLGCVVASPKLYNF